MISSQIAIYIAVAVVVISAIAGFLLTRRKASDAVLLTGLCGAGKTVVFHKLKSGKFVETVTSMKDTAERLPVKTAKKQSIRNIVDVPGHHRLRPLLHQHMDKGAAAVVYLIDGASFKAQSREVAEYLYDILVSAKLRKNRTPIQIAINKTDEPSCSSEEFVKTTLITELEKLRTSKSSMGDTADTSSVPLCSEGSSFQFEDLPMRVSFSRISAKSEGGLEPLVSFIV